MRVHVVVALLLVAAMEGCQARVLLQGAPAAEAVGGQLKVGMQLTEFFPVFYKNGSTFSGFDVGLRDDIEQRADIPSQLVLLNTLDDRITGLENGTVDWVVASFSVTPQRAQRVDFVKPYYYSAGAALFAPGGYAPGITSWESVRGRRLAMLDGYFASDILRRNYGAQVVPAASPEDGASKVLSGAADAFVYDSTNLRPAGNLRMVTSIPPLLPSPYAVAVRKGNSALASRISNALYEMATGGSNSDLARLEQQYFIANGAQPNPDLAALLANPRGTSSLLSGATGGVGQSGPSATLSLP